MADPRKHRVSFDCPCLQAAWSSSPGPGTTITSGCRGTPPDLAMGVDSPEITCRRSCQVRADQVIPMGTAYAGSEMDSQPSSLSLNSGDPSNSVNFESTDFQKDCYFVGGDTISTNVKVGLGKGFPLYQTARIGNFTYKFSRLDPGDYVVTLYLAEIVFTTGPLGMRIFDVFIQEQKVVSGVDIFSQVGSNRPLDLSDIRVSVQGEEGLTIRFEGVVGRPLVCGISVKIDLRAAAAVPDVTFDTQLPTIFSSDTEEQENSFITEDRCIGCKRLSKDYHLLRREKLKIFRDLEHVKRENDLKSKECYEAWMSLQELQTELMRKSMHVGSLAVAVEGQVKERTRWFAALREVNKKFELLKVEHARLSSEASEYKRNLIDMVSMSTMIQSAATMSDRSDLEKAHIKLRAKFIEEAKGRKEYYNKLLELKGNIRVFCRCRPLHAEERCRGISTVVDFEFAKEGELSVRAPGAPRKVFKFDSVFSPEAEQETVFENTSQFATSVMDGFNVCIFAYGQTGAGKTFTMEGTREARGVNYRTLEEVFRIIAEREGLFRYEISVSALEVYNEHIRDLLSIASHPGAAAKRLEIKQVSEGVHHVPGLFEARVSNMNEVWKVLQRGSDARAVGATNCNEHSSRSHCIHCVMVRGENLISGECTRSKLWLIDLAGSERLAKTDVQGERLKEAQSINKSLSALGDVIYALATKSPHVPFRNSKLTHLLQDSLGGDSKTLMFVQISPSESDVSETLCSLNFASRVRGIELGPAKRQFDTSEASKCKHMVEKVKNEIKSKEEYIKRMEETVSCMETKMWAKEMTNKNLQDRVKELEAQLLIERKLARQHVDTKIAENQYQKQLQQFQERGPYSSPGNGSNRLATKSLLNNLQTDIAAVSTTTFTADVGHNKISPAKKAPFKENQQPEVTTEESLHFPRKTSRFSISAVTKRTSIVPAPRRESLIPAPAIKPMEAPIPFFTFAGSNNSVSPPIPEVTPPLHDSTTNTADERTTTLIGRRVPQNQQPHGSGSTRRISSILRRSLQKRVIIKTPLRQQQQYARRWAGNSDEILDKAGTYSVGREVLLVGSKARRVPVEAGRDQQQQKWKKGKERWRNLGAAATRNFVL